MVWGGVPRGSALGGIGLSARAKRHRIVCGDADFVYAVYDGTVSLRRLTHGHVCGASACDEFLREVLMTRRFERRSKKPTCWALCVLFHDLFNCELASVE